LRFYDRSADRPSLLLQPQPCLLFFETEINLLRKG
jgi:hypothetical protein